MWLTYGVDAATKTLVAITDVESGKTTLSCPYCGKRLTAKKGKIKQHHFAHTDATCYPVATKVELPNLPLYDSFDLYLSGKDFDLLKNLWKSCGENNWTVPFASYLKPFIRQKLLVKNVCRTPIGYEFTALGKIPVSALPLAEFNIVQEPLLLDKLASIDRRVQLAKVLKSLNERESLIDWYIYRAQFRRILQQQLYYLEILADGEVLHKIGVTKREMRDRLSEIYRDLSSYYKKVNLTVLGTWTHRGNVEKYFKYRYKKFNYQIGSLTEYYKFIQPELVMIDLQQMQPKLLHPTEIDILNSSEQIPNNLVEWD